MTTESLVSAQSARRVWPAAISDFANQHGVADYLDPLWEATTSLFPNADEPTLLIEHDPEIEGDAHLLWELAIPFTSVPEFVAAQKSWIDELCRICPAPLTCVFRLALNPVSHGPA